MTACRSCGAPVRWVQMTDSKKLMPLDPEPVENGNVELCADGKTAIMHTESTTLLFPVPLYLSHFATCPHADEWREKKVIVRGHVRNIPPPAQRHSATSVAAATAIAPASGNLREQVYQAIAERGPVTDEQLADLLEMNPSTVRPRRIELQRAGRIRQDGNARTRSGRTAVTWRAW